jgi:hypothetical protein
METPITNEPVEVKDSPQTDKEIVDQIFKERDQYQQANRVQRDTFNDIYQAYVGEMSDVKDRSKSQEKIMKLRTEVNYIVPSIFSGEPELECNPIGDEDKDIAYVGEKIINFDLNNIPQAYEKIEAWVKQSVVFGTSFMQVLWKFVTTKNPDGSETPVSDEPDIAVPNILDCFYNPIISEVENQNSLIFRSVLSVDQIKDNPAYNYTDSLGQLNREKVAESGNINSNIYDSSNQVKSDRMDMINVSKGTVAIYERITSDRIQTVADGKERLLLRDEAKTSGFIEAVKLIHEPSAIPNRLEGYGVGHNTLGLGKMIQKLSNRLQDAVNLANNPHFIGKKGAGIDKRQLVIKCGGYTEVDGEGPLDEQFHAVPLPDIKQGGLALLNRFDDEHKRASGANDMIQGAASNKTLGQDQLASSYSANRFELINRRFKQALSDVGRMILMLRIKNIQSVDDPILKIFPLQAEITDAGEIKYSRETVYQMLIAARDRDDLKFNIQVKGETNVARNKDIQIKQLIEGFNIFGQILPPQNQLEWAKKFVELRGLGDASKLVPDPEQMAQQQQGIDPMTGQPMQGPMQQQGMPQGMTQQPSAIM